MRIALIDVAPMLAGGLRAGLADHTMIIAERDVLGEDVSEDVAGADLVIQGLPETGTDLDRLDRATRGTWNVLTTHGVRRYLQLSTLALFDAYDPGWAVDESWLTAPTDDPGILAYYLAELTAREIGHSRGIDVQVLRMDRMVPANRFATGGVRPDWLHVDDAVAAVVALVRSMLDDAKDRPRWEVWHAARGNGRYSCTKLATKLGVAPKHPGPSLPPGPPPKFPPRPAPVTQLASPRAVTIYGAGGALGSVVAAELAATGALLCLTNRWPLSELAAAPTQSATATRTTPPNPPSREVVVDVTDQKQVGQAALGSECLINCSVVRSDPRGAFAVNVLGAHTIMRAAIDHGIRRVVHTGPAQVLFGYEQDRLLSSATPARPGDRLYFLTKLLGQEICRIIAEQHAIAAPVLLFEALTVPDQVGRVSPFMITWRDAGRAVAAAAHVEQLPEPSPVINILAPAPPGRYRETEAQRLLEWQPIDRLDHVWTRAHADPARRIGG